MHMRIQEFADLTGVSVRTLHHYDAIGLLKPAAVDQQTGYRFYDEASLARMQEILFYRELGFPLREIGTILSSPHYDKQTAFRQQRQLLILKKERLERIIAALDGAMKGETVVTAFDNREFEKKRKQYEAEAKEKWGSTAAYAEYEAKTGHDSAAQQQARLGALEQVFADFAHCITGGAAPDSPEAQALVQALQTCITEHFYTCTKPILAGLGQMYVSDERFRNNIDRYADGTAEFVSRAIEIYCK